MTDDERGKYDEYIMEPKNEIALIYYLLKSVDLSRISMAAAKSCLLKLV